MSDDEQETTVFRRGPKPKGFDNYNSRKNPLDDVSESLRRNLLQNKKSILQNKKLEKLTKIDDICVSEKAQI
jgi:hypothetical protein